MKFSGAFRIALLSAMTMGHRGSSMASEFQDKFPTAESFDETTRVCGAHYSYRNDPLVFEDLGGGLKFLDSFGSESESGTDVGIALLAIQSTKRLIVSFRGDDGDFELTPFRRDSLGTRNAIDGRVTSDFQQALFGPHNLYQDVDAAVLDALEEYSDYAVTIVGHSHGAALAALYGAHAALNLSPGNDDTESLNVTVQTIGSPRVGDATFKKSIRALENLAIWRLVYNDDAVPRVPLRVQEYRHVGHLILLRGNETKAFYQQTGSEEYAWVPDRLWQVDTCSKGLLLPLFHNVVWYYEQGIQKAIENGWWPDKFVPREEQEPVCCYHLFWCWRQCTFDDKLLARHPTRQ